MKHSLTPLGQPHWVDPSGSMPVGQPHWVDPTGSSLPGQPHWVKPTLRASTIGYRKYTFTSDLCRLLPLYYVIPLLQCCSLLHACKQSTTDTAQSWFVCLLEVYTLATLNVISGWLLTCDSVHLWRPFSNWIYIQASISERVVCLSPRRE